MPWKENPEFTRWDKAARVIQQAWKNFLNVTIYQHLKSMIDLRREGEPRQIMKFINPKEAELLDAAAGIHVRFRLGGAQFPPQIYYKIFTERHIEDLCANSPRDYTKLPAKHTSHNKSDHLQEEDHSGWYRRIENNGWRPVADRLMFGGHIILRAQINIRQTVSRRKLDLTVRYYTGSLEAQSTHPKTVGLIQTATKGLMRAIEDGGVDSVMEWEVDEVLNWTNTLNFDEYIANWKEIATSNSSANFEGFRFTQAQRNRYDYEDISEMQMGTADNTFYDSLYQKLYLTRLTPDSTYGI